MTLLELRNRMKKRAPEFKRQAAGAGRRQFEQKWKHPRGDHSKLKRGIIGHGRRPVIGFASPKQVRGLNRAGFIEVLINNVKDLKKINTKNKVAVLSSTVGLKKRIEVLKKIKEKKITIINVKDVDKFIKDAEEKMVNRKLESKKREERKQKSKSEAEKKKQEETKKEEVKETDKEKELVKKGLVEGKGVAQPVVKKQATPVLTQRATAPKSQ